MIRGSLRARVAVCGMLAGAGWLAPTVGRGQQRPPKVERHEAVTRLELRATVARVRLHARVPLEAHALVGDDDRGAVRDVRYEATCGTVDAQGVLVPQQAGACTVTAHWRTPGGAEATGTTVLDVVDMGPVGEGGGAMPPRGPPPVRAPPPPVHAPPTLVVRTDELPQFPWPPPRSTSRAPIPRGLVTRTAASSDAETVDTLGEVADRIEAALDRAGIERAVYAIGDSGFVYVTRAEMIDRAGRPMPPPNRFPADLETASGSHGFLDFIVSRFRARPGFFRIIAIVVTSRPIMADTAGLTVDEATRLVEGGMATLPQSLRRRAVTGLEAAALIYEYQRRSQADAVTLRSAPLVSVDRHLAAAGLWSMDQLRGAP